MLQKKRKTLGVIDQICRLKDRQIDNRYIDRQIERERERERWRKILLTICQHILCLSLSRPRTLPNAELSMSHVGKSSKKFASNYEFCIGHQKDYICYQINPNPIKAYIYIFKYISTYGVPKSMSDTQLCLKGLTTGQSICILVSVLCIIISIFVCM